MTGQHIVLVGLMSSGKSTIGPPLAERLGRPWLDSDEHIQATYGKLASEIAEEAGVERLHELEHHHLLDALATEEPAVIATAASTADSDVCLEAMEQAFVVWLQRDLQEIVRKVERAEHRRNLGPDPLATLHEQLERRGPRWAKVAALQLPDAKHHPEQAIEQILAALEAAAE